jgi:DNA-binding NarL/FixJ family response regulator
MGRDARLGTLGLMASSDSTRMLIIEDVPQVAQYIRGLLNTQGSVKLLDVITDGSKVIPQIQQLRPDVVLFHRTRLSRIRPTESMPS